MTSILNSIKKLLGILDDYTEFDTDLIININSAFMVLHQLGVGPKDCFSIIDSTQTWEEFLGDHGDLNATKTYIYLKVKLMFDPPSSSFVLSSIDSQIQELEYRLLLQAKGGDDYGRDEQLSRTPRRPRNEMGCP